MTLDNYVKKSLKDPEFKKAYDALEPEYALKHRLIELRMKKKLSQQEIATRAGTHQSSIARFEHGDYSPTISFLSRLASAVGMKLEVRFV
ncbi:MAG: helix-turn-helix domain-containing protein [Patescibacteria group bacterium]|nr:helix-turn-helix domain-containing protein [Patescibacteria group bacterium]MCL5431940.1 helix-turn-helix domain-containing protein [Patescibacteria group bacterium]